MSTPAGGVADTVESAVSPEWEAWMGAWEDHLSSLVAFVADNADVAPPEPPTVPQPDAPTPAALRTRLLRAEALRQQVTRDIAAQLAAGRRWSSPDPEGAVRSLGSL